MLGFIIAMLVMLAIMLALRGISQPSRYPDGKCYMCRRGAASPGETCSQCGTEQPEIRPQP